MQRTAASSTDSGSALPTYALLAALPPLFVGAALSRSPVVALAACIVFAVTWRLGARLAVPVALAATVTALRLESLAHPIHTATALAIVAAFVGALAAGLALRHRQLRRRPRAAVPQDPPRMSLYATPPRGVRPPRPTPDLRRPVPDADAGARSVERDVVLQLLRDVRSMLGGDEVVLWRREEGDDVAPIAWASGGPTAPELRSDPSAESLAHWAIQQGLPAGNYDTDPALLLAAPVGRDEHMRGAITVYVADRTAVQRDYVKARLPQQAGRVTAVLDLLHEGRETRRYRGKAEVLARAAERLQSSQDVAGLGQAICEAAVELTAASRAAFVEWDGVGGRVTSTSAAHAVRPGLQVSSESLVGRACSERMRLVRERYRASDAPLFGDREPARQVGSVVVVPLRGVEWSLGAIAAEADDASELTAVESSLLQLLASVSGVALERVRQLEQATQASRTDPLTQLANRRVFDESLAQHLAECDRYGQTLSLVLADVDHFKSINDTYGHTAGDTVLVALGRTFANAVRDVDLCARYGGEELAFLLPLTPLDRARDVAERLRRSAEELAVHWKGKRIPVTVSFGVACYPVSAGRGDALFASADRALYEAKKSGRNCVKYAMPSTHVKTA